MIIPSQTQWQTGETLADTLDDIWEKAVTPPFRIPGVFGCARRYPPLRCGGVNPAASSAWFQLPKRYLYVVDRSS
jgi:hypothetical protein